LKVLCYSLIHNLRRDFKMKAKLLVAVPAIALSIALPATTFAGFYPADRQTYTCGATRADGTTPCEGADHVVFNSFTNNPVVGDERPFLAGSMNGANVTDTVNVKDGDIVNIRAYVHNNADPNKIGASAAVAKNVRIHVQLPTDSKANQTIVAFISADNANPGTINDTMQLAASGNMTVSYVPGSAKFQHSVDGTTQRLDTVDDTIVSKDGASLGAIKGCFEYSGYVTLQVKVSIPTTPKPPVTPPTTTTTTPTKLVNTGAGSVIGIFAAATAAGAAAYRVVLGRRLSRQ
jgi:hypothetical protein